MTALRKYHKIMDHKIYSTIGAPRRCLKHTRLFPGVPAAMSISCDVFASVFFLGDVFPSGVGSGLREGRRGVVLVVRQALVHDQPLDALLVGRHLRSARARASKLPRGRVINCY